ncbi:putative histone-lysine N-methyltransferase 1 [Aphidius gifuensis]|uniref:putative histone-lysine N-methyltransferase 1 n=1 Tax=Aphidius gifuensis TaxID=684658 RepID=UPI001CDC4BF7|nr:putative histone-lysine N-methyltransferase 1 [Aphidius gifuensis]
MVSPSKIQQLKDKKALSKDSTRERNSHIRLTKGDKPLLKKSFYLDVKNHGLSNKLENKIKNFGGIVEVFLVKSVTLVVSDRVDNKTEQQTDKRKWAYTSGGSGGPPSLRSIEPQTPTRTPTTPSLDGECPLSNSTNTRGQTGQRTKSRADAMLERALIQPQKCSVDPLDNALNWGIPIWTTDKLQNWLDKIYISLKESGNINKCVVNNNNKSGTDKDLKVKDFKKPYIKFESFKRETRPVFLELPVWPTINFDGDFGSCPFDRKKKQEDKQIKINKSDIKGEMTRRPRATATRTRRSEQLVSGYCEICRVDYKDLTKHVQSDKHLAFVKNSDNFLSLDTLIESGASVEAFLKPYKPDDGQNIFTNGNDVIDKVEATTTPPPVVVDDELSNFNVDELKMVQCNGARRRLNLKLSSSHNLRTRAKHESGHLLRSKGSPWHESDNKSDKFFENLDGYTIKKRSKGTIWIEEDDNKSDDDNEDQEHEEQEKEEVKDDHNHIDEQQQQNNKKESSKNEDKIDEKIPLTELNDDVRLKTKELRCNNQKKSSPSLTKWEERNNNNNKDKEKIKNQSENELKINDKCNTRLVASSDIDNKLLPKEKKSLIITQNSNTKLSEVLKKDDVDSNDNSKINKNKFNRRSIRSSRSRQRLSIEERLLNENRSYYKVEVLGSKLRSNAQCTNSQTIKLPTENKHVDKDINKQQDDKVQKLNNDNNDASSEKPVVVRFKRVRKSELSLLSDEAESFMFGDARRDESSGDDADNDDDQSSVLPKETSSDLTDDKSSSSIVISSPIKQEPIDDDSHDDSSSRAKKRRRTQAEVFIRENTDYYKFETTGSRLRFQGQIADKKLRENFNNDKNNDVNISTKEKVDNISDNNKLLNNIDDDNNIEILYPSKPSAKIEKMNFSFEIIPKSEPWYQTYQRQDDGSEYWHYFSDCDDRKPFMLPYEIENFHEHLRAICQKNNETKKKNKLNGFVRLPRKSPRCHASTLAIMSTLIRKREQQQQQQQEQQTSTATTTTTGSTTTTTTSNQQQPSTNNNLNSNNDIDVDMKFLTNSLKLDKSSTDLELCQIVKNIDEMLNAEIPPNDSFEPETITALNNDYEINNIKSSGPPDNLLDLLENCHQHINGFENSSCASSECGETITESSSSSPLKRRKRRKNRTGWPGNKIRKKLHIIKQEKELSQPDVDSERENLPTKNQNNTTNNINAADDDDDDEDYNQFYNDDHNNDNNIDNKIHNGKIICDKITVNDNIDKKLCKLTNDVTINDCQTSNNLIDNNHDNLFRKDITTGKKLTNNKSTTSTTSSSATSATSSSETSSASSESSSQKNNKDNDVKPSSSSSPSSSSLEDNTTHSESNLFRKKSTIISRKNYTTNIKTKQRETTTTTAKTNGHDTLSSSDSTSDNKNNSSELNYNNKKQIINKNRNKKQRNKNKIDYDNENYDKKDTIDNDIDCNERVNTPTREIRQRRSSIEFQPVVRVMKIDEQVDIDHNILSVTVASNRRLRSSSSPRSQGPPSKRCKRERGPFGRWSKYN